jgi:hypothetical protein
MLPAVNINMRNYIIFAKIIVTKIASMTPKLFSTNMLPINFITFQTRTAMNGSSESARRCKSPLPFRRAHRLKNSARLVCGVDLAGDPPDCGQCVCGQTK